MLAFVIAHCHEFTLETGHLLRVFRAEIFMTLSHTYMSWDALPEDVRQLIWQRRLTAMAEDAMDREHHRLYAEFAWYWPQHLDPGDHVDRVQRLNRLLLSRGISRYEDTVSQLYALYNTWARYYE